MLVRFSRANEAANSFDVLGHVFNVGKEDFERMRAECAASDGEDDDVVADLVDGFDLVDTVCISRQMHVRAASVLRMK